MSECRFKVGDRVVMWKEYKKVLMPAVMIVTSVTQVDKTLCESGWCINALRPECPHCGNKEKKFIGYDSSWFEFESAL